MKKRILSIWLLYVCNASMVTHALTLTWLVRLRRVFSLVRGAASPESNVSLTALPTVYQRKRHVTSNLLNQPVDVHNKQLYLGSLFNACYHDNKHNWWAEATTALAQEFVSLKGTNNLSRSRIGFDDILVSVGYDLNPHKLIEIIPFITAGFPTRLKVNPYDIYDTAVGTRFFGLAQGLEMTVNLFESKTSKTDFVFQQRIAHFFDRKFFPIIPREATYALGNETDLVFAIQHGTSSGLLEVGYNPTYYTNQGVKFPHEPFIKNPTFFGNTLYASYLHNEKELPLINRTGGIGCGGLYTFAGHYHARVISFWLTLNVTF